MPPGNLDRVHNVEYMVNSLAVPLDITVMINDLQKINKILHRKNVETNKFVGLFKWFHNESLEKNYSKIVIPMNIEVRHNPVK